ncbi:MAG: ArnT family glycosyltransferase [Candidatus Spyradenecus sp.]
MNKNHPLSSDDPSSCQLSAVGCPLATLSSKPFNSASEASFVRHLALICLGLLLVVRVWNMATLSLWDPSEARYASIAANMARSGDFIRPAFYHHDCYQTFAGKPPLSFQLGAVACKVLGESAFAVRLPSLLCALAILWMLRRTAGNLRAPLICLTTPGFLLLSGICMTDMPLACAIFATLLCARAYLRRPGWGPALCCAAAAAAGFLIKGPVALVLGGLPPALFALLNRRRVSLRHVLAAGGLFLLLVAPWFVAMEVREPGTLRYFFLNENLGRFLVQEYGDRYGSGHKTFCGVAAVWFLVGAAPWSLALFRRRAWHRLRANFPALATVTMVGFWCLTPRCPVAYLLPAIPPAAWWIAQRPARSFRSWPALAYAFALALFVGTLLLPRLKPHKFPAAFYASLPPNATVSFIGAAPYSADFYLGPRIRRDGSGEIKVSREKHHLRRLP